MSQFQLVPLDRVHDYFEDQAGIPISKGSIVNFNVEASEKVEKFETWAKEQLTASAVNHADETGIHVGGKKVWLHNLSNEKVTLLHADKKRGKEAIDRMGVLPKFNGILCHDHWKPYFQYPCSHSLCNAHHLRELEWSVEFEKQVWAEPMKDLLTEINDEKIKAGFIGEEQQANFQKRYRTILSQGENECPVTKENTYSKTKYIAEYVLKKYQVFDSISGMTYWMKKHGFAYQKPVSIPGKCDTHQQTVFIEEYQPLKEGLSQ